MLDPRKGIFDEVRKAAPAGLFSDAGNILALDNLLDAFGVAREPKSNSKVDTLTIRMVLELLEHEAIVPEAYRDSKGVWTWGVGVTNASGHHVNRYKDNPQTIQRCLEIYIWLLREKYLPGVLAAFRGHALMEHELAAALSFHYNTGAIGTADWVALARAGKTAEAKAAFMNWSKPKEIIPRRKLERNLFFGGEWSSDGIVTMYTEVNRPSYSPKWSSARQVDVRGALEGLLR